MRKHSLDYFFSLILIGSTTLGIIFKSTERIAATAEEQLNRNQVGFACKQAQVSNSSDAEDYMQKAAARIKSRDYRGAIANYNAAIRLSPQYAYAYMGRALVLDMVGDFKGEIADSNEAVRLAPKCILAYKVRGFARTVTGNKAGARADLQQAAALCREQGDESGYQQVLEMMKKLNL
jgi:tetratricopeptide (TPR) repeat protein